jgi:hypothetical protein
MKHDTSRELYRYWDGVRRGEPAPKRSDIEPSDIRRVLADTFILEVVDRENYVVRLAGTRICAAQGREIKGMNFLDLFAPEDRQAIATLAAAISEDAAAAVVTLAAATARQRPLSCEMLLLPLRHDGSGYDRILGSIAPFDRPYWLGTEPVTRLSVVSLRLIWPDEQPAFMRRATDNPTPATLIPFPVDSRRRRGHLYVVDGGTD